MESVAEEEALAVNAEKFLSLKYPELSNFSNQALPCALKLMDKIEPESISKGLKLMNHCLENLTKTEVQRSNWSLVIYDGVSKLLHHKEKEIVDEMVPCLLKILSIVEEDPHDGCHKFSKYDDSLQTVLFTVEYSCSIPEKKVWMPHLNTFLITMGFSSLHWTEKILSLLNNCTLSSDPEMWLLILQNMETCIKNMWIKPPTLDWMEIILKICFNIAVFTNDSTYSENEALVLMEGQIKKCIVLMRQLDNFEEVVKQFNEILCANSEEDILYKPFMEELFKYKDTVLHT